jgi:hypothetical protein
VASPAATVVTTPELEIVATEGDEDVQFAVCVKLLTLPSLYVPEAQNCCEIPMASVALVGDMRIAVIALTVTVAVPDTPRNVAVMVLVPSLTPVTMPPGATVATDVLEEDQATYGVMF